MNTQLPSTIGIHVKEKTQMEVKCKHGAPFRWPTEMTISNADWQSWISYRIGNLIMTNKIWIYWSMTTWIESTSSMPTFAGGSCVLVSNTMSTGSSSNRMVSMADFIKARTLSHMERRTGLSALWDELLPRVLRRPWAYKNNNNKEQLACQPRERKITKA